jgi:hypothetical protein
VSLPELRRIEKTALPLILSLCRLVAAMIGAVTWRHVAQTLNLPTEEMAVLGRSLAGRVFSKHYAVSVEKRWSLASISDQLRSSK